MSALTRYLELIVEPTVEEFRRNPTSLRHAYLACVATYHAVDRVSYPKSPRTVAEQWRKKSREFAIVDIVAHDFKHVKSDKHRQRPDRPSIPIGLAIYGTMAFGTGVFGGDRLPALRNIRFVVENAVRFIKREAVTMG
jgi:hypothetical protein